MRDPLDLRSVSFERVTPRRRKPALRGQGLAAHTDLSTASARARRADVTVKGWRWKSGGFGQKTP